MTARYYLMALAATVVALAVLAIIWPKYCPYPQVAFGGGLAALNGLAAALVNRSAIRAGDPERFWIRCGIGHGLRLLILVILLFSALRIALKWASGLVIPLMTGYVCFLAAEIAAIQRHSRSAHPSAGTVPPENTAG